jgi:nucleoside-diphosphate-sugar epimerase
VIPTIVTQLAAGSREVRLGDVTTTRDFTYVEDTCRGFLTVASLEAAAGEVFNIGSNSEVSIGEVLQTIAAYMGVDVTAVKDDERMRPAASEVRRLRCDTRKLEQASCFRPTVPFTVGIGRTVEWFRDPRNLARYKGDLYNV